MRKREIGRQRTSKNIQKMFLPVLGKKMMNRRLNTIVILCVYDANHIHFTVFLNLSIRATKT